MPDGIHEQYVRLLRASPRSSTSRRAGAAERLDLGLLRLGQVELREAARARPRRSRAPRRDLARRGAPSPGHVPSTAELRTPGTSSGRRSTRSPSSSTSAASRATTSTSTRRPSGRSRRLGYCTTEPLVADFELKLERDNEWAGFEQTGAGVLGRPWAEAKDKQLAEEDFSLVLSVMYPERYTDPMSWFTSRAGTHARAESPEEAVAAIRDMLKFRRPRATLFLVVDEVSQYVLSNKDRVDRLRAFATALGATLKGKAWLVALGQQKLDEEADDSFLVWAKDRFPPKLRVHLAATNIRDVVHKRLLQKQPEARGPAPGDLREAPRDLKLFAYGCDSITAEEFVEVYPMLPGHVDLLLQITTALRTRSARAQGDDQAIRGLLQLLGELFRDQKLADMPVGSLVTLDQVYEVQHTALDSDVQASMARILNQCADDPTDLLTRGGEGGRTPRADPGRLPTDAKLVAQCLYDRVDRGNHVNEITEALEKLRRRNLLGYSEKQGYKIQSTAGEEWERERRDIGVAREDDRHARPGRPEIPARDAGPPAAARAPIPVGGGVLRRPPRRGRRPRRPAGRGGGSGRLPLPGRDERTESAWVRKSAEVPLSDRLVWLCGDTDQVEQARGSYRSRDMVKKKPARVARPRAEAPPPAGGESRRRPRANCARFGCGGVDGRSDLLPRPADRAAGSRRVVRGRASRRGHPDPAGPVPALRRDRGRANRAAAASSRALRPVAQFLTGELGILELDSGRYVPSCGGVVPRRVQEYVESEGGLGGGTSSPTSAARRTATRLML